MPTAKEVVKGTRGMPWLPEAMKGVVSCDKPRGGAKQPVIRGFPNGATRQPEGLSSRFCGRQTRRTETS